MSPHAQIKTHALVLLAIFLFVAAGWYRYDQEVVYIEGLNNVQKGMTKTEMETHLENPRSRKVEVKREVSKASQDTLRASWAMAIPLRCGVMRRISPQNSHIATIFLTADSDDEDLKVVAVQ